MSNLSNSPSNKDLFFLHLELLNLNKKTVRNYKSDFNHFLEWLRSNNIHELNSERIRDYLNFLRTTNTPTKTINRRLTTLRHYAKYLRKYNITDYDLAENIQNFGTNTSSGDFTKQKQAVPILISVAIAILLILQVIITDEPRSPWDPILASSPDHKLSEEIKITDQPSFKNKKQEFTIYLKDNASGKPVKLTDAEKQILLNSDPEIKKSGKATLYKNQNSTIIYSEAVTADSLIHLTPTSSTNNQTLYIDIQKEGYFIVRTAHSADFDISFNWWITNY